MTLLGSCVGDEQWVGGGLLVCNFRDGIATNSSEYNQIRRANKCSSRWSASSSINTTLLAEINVHEIFVRNCTKKKIISLSYPFHILFQEQERSFAKRVVAQSLIKLIELNKNIYIYRNHQGDKEMYPQNLKSLVISHRDEGQTRKAT